MIIRPFQNASTEITIRVMLTNPLPQTSRRNLSLINRWVRIIILYMVRLNDKERQAKRH